MLPTIYVYFVLGAVAIAYAFALNSPAGKKIADEHTWLTVVIGTSLVLCALFFIMAFQDWLNILIAFAVAGTPMIARSLINKSRAR